MKDKIWLDGHDKFVLDRPDSRDYLLLREIGNIVDENNNLSVLDYGCGEGLISRHITPTAITFFDINPDIIKLAKEEAIKNHFTEISIIDNNKKLSKEGYDMILLSLVLVTCSSLEEFEKIIKDCYGLLKKGGKLIVGDTHPCFRDEEFSTFRTSFCDKIPFNYNKEFMPFEVQLRTYEEDKFIKFHDYHYTLSTLFRCSLELKFQISDFIELKDESDNMFFNSKKPTYYILTLKK